MRESLVAGNECDRASIYLRNAPANLGNLGFHDLRGNVVSKALHKAVSEFSAFGCRKLLGHFEDLGY